MGVVNLDSFSFFNPPLALMGVKLEGVRFTGVNAPLMGVKPRFIDAFGFLGVVPDMSVSGLSADALKLKIPIPGVLEPRDIGEAADLSTGDRFAGDAAGEGVIGPPNSASICCCTLGFADFTHSSYGCR